MNELRNIVVKYCDNPSKENLRELMNCLHKFITEEYDRTNIDHVVTFLSVWNALRETDIF